MTANRWTEIERLCLAALERDRAARAAFLDEACAGDLDLRREVDSLLAHESVADALLEVAPIEIAARALATGDEAHSAGADPDGPEPCPSEPLARGTRLGPYEIDELIAAGGMGEVYRALDTRLGREVAVKLLPHQFAADPERLRRFELEARAVAALNHPNILAIHDIAVSEAIAVAPSAATPLPGRPLHYLVMELLEGETLRERIARGPLPVGDALDISGQIVRALAAAHDKHIVHRDLKPSNVLLMPGGQVKLLDFGIAKVVGATDLDAPNHPANPMPTTQTGPRMGTAGYMSPEQAMGLPTDARSDIFSFGTVLYEMLAGQRAFKGDTPSDTRRAILGAEPPPLGSLRHGVAPELQRLVDRCLEKEAVNRFSSAHDLAVALEAAAFGRGRARRLLVPAAVLLVAAAVGGALYLQRRSPEPAEQISRTAAATHPRGTIAVLPLQNLSADPGYAYFAGGLHDELLSQLSKVAALKVISRTSVMGYQATSKPLGQIAEELHAGTVVEGSVQVVGGRLRVNVELIDATTDQYLWSERYDRTLDDAFAVQSEIAEKIVGAVGAALATDEQRRIARAPTASAEAYRFYLQGQEYLHRPGYLEVNHRIAQQLFERALALDPAFALAHAAISQVHGQVYWFRWDTSPARAAREREEADEALRLAPDLPEAHVAMGFAHYFGPHEYRRALDELTLAARGLPNDAEIVSSIGYINRRLGNWDAVDASFAKAAQLNPRDVDLFFDLGGETLTLRHRYRDAVAAYDRALSLAPDLHFVAIRRGLALLLWQGKLDPLREVLNALPEDAELSSGISVAGQRAALLLLERNADGLLQMAEVSRGSDFAGHMYFLPGALYRAWAQQLRGNGAAARAAFDAARVRLDAAVRELPDDWRIHAARGLALAGLGRRTEATAEARWLQQSDVYRGDAHFGPIAAEFRAQILAQSGYADAALDEIERLLPGPSWLSVHTLRLDPRWDPIRAHPRFQALLRKYGS
jgi:eukaryotic-like serine/threonine-protein kinase